MSKLRPWIQVVQPHEDIRKGRFDESIFAADLGEVLVGRGALEYRDPDIFFRKTYITEELSALISGVMLRSSGKKGVEPVIQLQTPFGGGKTHALLTIYHLIKNKKNASKFKGIQQLLKEAGVEEIPDIKIAAIDGDAVNADEIRRTADGLSIRTLWGEIAYQLGGKPFYKLIEDADQKRMVPGTNLIGEILDKAAKSLILIDELLIYVKACSAIKVGESYLKGQVLAFIKELADAVSNHPTAILIVTLPSSTPEHLDEEGEMIYQELAKMLGRRETIKEPVHGEEIYEIVRKRLFEDLGPETEAEKVADTYWEFYQTHKEDLPRKVREPTYKKLLAKAYPFHPETINVLREQWGTYVNFQKTRGVLRLLALVVADLYKRKHAGCLIQSSHFNLGNSEIASELLKFTGRQFEGIIAADISGPTAKAPQIDRDLGSEYARENVTEGLATAIFLYSFSGKGDGGINEPNLRLAVLHPDMIPSIFAEALNRTIQRFYFIDDASARRGMYRFAAQENLNKKLIDIEDSIKKADITEFAHEKLWNLIGDKFPKKYRFPEEDRDVADSPTLSLVVLGLERTKGKETWKDSEKFIQDLLNTHGTLHRKFKNSLVFLMPDETYKQQLLKNVKRYLALQHIAQEYKAKGLTEEQKRDLQLKIKSAEVEVPQIIASSYRHIVIGGDKKELKTFDMGTFVYVPSNPLSNMVWQTLKDNEKLLEKIDPNLITGTKFSLWPSEKQYINTKTLMEYFTQYTNLPILADESVLKTSICQGINRGLFGLGLGEPEKFDTVYFKKTVSESEIDLTETSWLLKPDIAQKFLPPEEKTKETGREITTVITTKGKEITEGGIKKVRDVSIKASIDWQNWDNFFREVIDPLINEGANVKIELTLSAHSDEGIKQDTIELKIKESLEQRNIEYKID